MQKFVQLPQTAQERALSRSLFGLFRFLGLGIEGKHHSELFLDESGVCSRDDGEGTFLDYLKAEDLAVMYIAELISQRSEQHVSKQASVEGGYQRRGHGGS